MKACTRCSLLKDLAEFSRKAASPDGLRTQCKACDAADVRRRSPEAREAALSSTRAWRDRNRDHVNASAGQYRRDNAAAVNERTRRRYAAQVGATVGPVDVAELHALYSDCYLCQQPLNGDSTQEHVIPLSRGGAHCMENLRLAHGACNSAKKDRLLSELSWYSGPTDIGVRVKGGV